ncbi:TolC family protein [Hydrogenimonas thermophila]|uniref:Outer membrane protein TolC n=1 Tax=Hydrogenimonas thermophila TaxID=223786 RepID=A0A1I5LHS5_9BACT|nr:TolC family protein [Hydrogenimonas thermophila]SFO96722.1 Outer membrane protein TolC [Hydrogenimonas thermophila]
MTKIVKSFALFIIIPSALLASNSIVEYVKTAQKRLSLEDQIQMINKEKNLRISAKKLQSFANFSVDIQYTQTKDQLLPNYFHTIDYSLSDNIDIFNKNSLIIEKLYLESEKSKYLIWQRKEQLFLSLVNMIAAYHRIHKLLTLHQRFYNEQKEILTKLTEAYKAGAIPKIESERFANALTLFHGRIVQEEELVKNLSQRLNLYVPDQPIPNFEEVSIHTDISNFIKQNPLLRYKKIESKIANKEAEFIKKSWLPDAVIGAAYQQNSDPTANGNNYSFFTGIHMNFDSGLKKEAEAAKVQALRVKSEEISLKIKEQERYLDYLGKIQAAKRKEKILKPALQRALLTMQRVKTAYLKHYIDFNSYLQTLQSLLSIQEEEIDALITKQKNIVILNTLSTGKIYE